MANNKINGLSDKKGEKGEPEQNVEKIEWLRMKN